MIVLTNNRAHRIRKLVAITVTEVTASPRRNRDGHAGDDTWTVAVARALHQRVCRLDPDATCSALEALLAREPLREGAHRLYLEALAARGEHARALAHYDMLTELLRREVGTRPARETRELAERLRTCA